MSCAPLISYTDDYAGAVPKARKGQALLPVDFHVFFPARQDCKLNFWDQGKSIFILFQLFSDIVSENRSLCLNSGSYILCAVPLRNPQKCNFQSAVFLHIICTAISAESSLVSGL